MKTIDEQLEDALARITQLDSDAAASASLLTEAGHQHERFRQEIAALSAEKETLTLANGELTDQRDQLSRDLATAKESLKTTGESVKELDAAKEQLSALGKEIESLKANAKSAERIAAERYGAASPQPLPVTSRGESKADELVIRFKAITNPAEQTAFWRSLTPEQRTLIQNAK
jgi:chromosome segregation ATPase